MIENLTGYRGNPLLKEYFAGLFTRRAWLFQVNLLIGLMIVLCVGIRFSLNGMGGLALMAVFGFWCLALYWRGIVLTYDMRPAPDDWDCYGKLNLAERYWGRMLPLLAELLVLPLVLIVYWAVWWFSYPHAEHFLYMLFSFMVPLSLIAGGLLMGGLWGLLGTGRPWAVLGFIFTVPAYIAGFVAVCMLVGTQFDLDYPRPDWYTGFPALLLALLPVLIPAAMLPLLCWPGHCDLRAALKSLRRGAGWLAGLWLCFLLVSAGVHLKAAGSLNLKQIRGAEVLEATLPDSALCYPGLGGVVVRSGERVLALDEMFQEQQSFDLPPVGEDEAPWRYFSISPERSLYVWNDERAVTVSPEDLQGRANGCVAS